MRGRRGTPGPDRIRGTPKPDEDRASVDPEEIFFSDCEHGFAG